MPRDDADAGRPEEEKNGGGGVGVVARAREIVGLANSLIIAPAVLVWVALVTSGYIPLRPLDDLTQRLTLIHAQGLAHQESDRRMVAAMEQCAQAIARYERRERLVECQARYGTDVKLRLWCMGLGDEEWTGWR